MSICKKCGHKSKPNAKFCTNCGSRLIKLNQQPIPQKLRMLFDSGLYLINNHQYEAGIKVFNKLLAIKPDWGEAWAKKGLILSNKGKHREALDCYNKAIELNPNLQQARKNRDSLLRDLEHEDLLEIKNQLRIRKDGQEKVVSYRNVDDLSHMIVQRIMKEKNLYSLWMAEAPSFQSLFDSKEVIYDDGLRFLEKMQLEEAVDFYKEALKDDPTNYLKWNNLGVAYMGLKERKDALKCYEKALESKASYYIGLYNKGAVYFVCEEYQEAINYFEKSLRLNPKCAEAYWDKHMANEKMGNFDFSTGTVEGLKMGLNIMRAKLSHSSALVDLGNGRDAILGHSILYLKDKEKIDNLFYRANDLHKRQKYQEALELLNNAIQLNPEDMDIWFLRGKTIYNLTKDHEEALRCVQNGLKIDKNSLKGWLLLTLFFYKGKEYEKALESLNRVLRINPFEKLANDLKRRILLDRCLNLKKQGKFYEAVKPLDLLLEDHPKDEGVWVEKGNMYVGMKDLNKAIGCFNTAIKIDPQNYHAHFNKGLLNLKQGNNTAAIKCFKEALKIRPNDPKAEKYIDIAKKATPDLLGMFQEINQLLRDKYGDKYDLDI